MYLTCSPGGHQTTWFVLSKGVDAVDDNQVKGTQSSPNREFDGASESSVTSCDAESLWRESSLVNFITAVYLWIKLITDLSADW